MFKYVPNGKKDAVSALLALRYKESEADKAARAAQTVLGGPRGLRNWSGRAFAKSREQIDGRYSSIAMQLGDLT